MPTALQKLDFAGIQFLHDLAMSSATAAFVFYIVADVLIFGFGFLLWYLWRRPEAVARHHGNQKMVILALMTVTLSLAAKAVLAFGISRPRPFVSHPDLIPFPIHVDSSSFPSGHTLIAMAIGASIWFSGNKKLGGWLMLLAVLIGVARVGAGVHYPSDIIGGALIAFFAAYFMHSEASSLKKYLPNS